jgi:glutaredoxin-related protein
MICEYDPCYGDEGTSADIVLVGYLTQQKVKSFLTVVILEYTELSQDLDSWGLWPIFLSRYRLVHSWGAGTRSEHSQ